MPVTNYIWDDESDNVLMETDENDITTAVYTQEPGEFGELISQRRDGETSYFEYDGTGSTRALTDEAGNRTDTYVYSGFGETIAKTGTTTNPYRFAGAHGYYFDEETEDYYVRERTYKPTIARFASTDPILFFGGMNLYAYVSNNPLNLVDPSGLIPIGGKCCPCECGDVKVQVNGWVLLKLRFPPKHKFAGKVVEVLGLKFTASVNTFGNCGCVLESWKLSSRHQRKVKGGDWTTEVQPDRMYDGSCPHRGNLVDKTKQSECTHSCTDLFKKDETTECKGSISFIDAPGAPHPKFGATKKDIEGFCVRVFDVFEIRCKGQPDPITGKTSDRCTTIFFSGGACIEKGKVVGSHRSRIVQTPCA